MIGGVLLLQSQRLAPSPKLVRGHDAIVLGLGHFSCPTSLSEGERTLCEPTRLPRPHGNSVTTVRLPGGEPADAAGVGPGVDQGGRVMRRADASRLPFGCFGRKTVTRVGAERWHDRSAGCQGWR